MLSVSILDTKKKTTVKQGKKRHLAVKTELKCREKIQCVQVQEKSSEPDKCQLSNMTVLKNHKATDMQQPLEKMRETRSPVFPSVPFQHF